jgi:hypothetical protein
VLLIGNQKLHGKLTDLGKAVAVMQKVDKPIGDADAITLSGSAMEDADAVLAATTAAASAATARVEYVVQGVVRRKLVFKSRPHPIVDTTRASLKRKH